MRRATRSRGRAGRLLERGASWGRDRVEERLDPRRRAELAGERTTFDQVLGRGLLDGARGGRVLEVGPKHGEDSSRLAGLQPAELVLLDLPEKREVLDGWLPGVRELAPSLRYVEGNLLYLEPDVVASLGRFDVVWCTGVLYHNAEQLRLLKRLFDLTADGGRVIVESATARSPVFRRGSVVEVHYPRTYRGLETVTHLPSRSAIAAWMQMVGYEEVEVLDIYSRTLARHRAVLAGTRRPGSEGYVSYPASAASGQLYRVGDAR